MTEQQHFIVAGIIIFIIWHVWIKKHYFTEKDRRRWVKKIKDFKSIEEILNNVNSKKQ